jgi:dUTP pyrophosphatase
MDLDIRVGELERSVREMRGVMGGAAPSRPTRVPCLRVGAHNLLLPEYAKPGDSGMDLRADLTFFSRVPKDYPIHDGTPTLPRGSTWLTEDRIRLDHGARLTVGCGFAFELPDGKEWQVRPRSGHSSKGVDGVFGTIDARYRGELALTICNWSGWPLTVVHGDRYAQIVLADVSMAELVEVAELGQTERGDSRHGSTGVR